MVNKTRVVERTFKRIDPLKQKQRIYGGLFILIAVFIWAAFSHSTAPDLQTIFVTTPGGAQIKMPDITFNTLFVLNALVVLCAAFGAYQLIKGFGKYTNFILSVVGILLVVSFLSWGAAGGSINVGGLLRVMILRSVPITLGALSGILCEQVGIVNIAIEGMMVTGALVGAIFGSLYGLWMGMLIATLAGGLISTIHAILSIKYKIDQIISGTIVNIFTIGLTSYVVTKILQNRDWQYLNQSGFFNPINLPVLSKIPYIGPIFFSHNIYVYIMYILVIFLTFALFYTKWGLRLRACGEHPKAADTLGINVFRTRYMGVILGGLLAGFAGSFFSLGSVGYFEQLMTAGRGFISLAAMIFGKWTPIGALGSGLLFGFSESLANNLSLLRFPIPAEFLIMMPYVLTMVILAGVVGRSRGPAASGKPYEKESL